MYIVPLMNFLFIVGPAAETEGGAGTEMPETGRRTG